ncbi:MAG: hypothetical protein AT708_00915 [Pyrobaculum sp. OCT_11]|jgi:hypothetical protein|nr:MAG: hypothetical protein AT708_00915 [Pyrobaculum sp. OCT_11]
MKLIPVSSDSLVPRGPTATSKDRDVVVRLLKYSQRRMLAFRIFGPVALWRYIVASGAITVSR